jgi:uncharacterized membrane protein YfcA
MDIVSLLGFFAAVLIGVSLGLIGGGGSILTLPALTYLFELDAKTATAYSLFIVGFSSLVGGIRMAKKGLVEYKTLVIFAVPALITVYITRAVIVPAIPNTLFTLGGYEVSGDLGIMVFFAIIMLLASFSMIRGKKEMENELTEIKYNYPMILLEGTVVGLVTGIVGAGGGFLIIPALVILARLPMKMAVGTSLLIIATKSLIGFLGDLGNPQIGAGNGIDWSFLTLFTAIAIGGIFIGIWLSHFISGNRLKKGFGWFVLLMAVYILSERISSLII